MYLLVINYLTLQLVSKELVVPFMAKTYQLVFDIHYLTVYAYDGFSDM